MTAPKPIGDRVHPAVRQVFQLVERESMMIKTLSWKSGYTERYLSNLKFRRRNLNPSLITLTNLAAVFDHEVVIVPKAVAEEIRKQFDEKLPR